MSTISNVTLPIAKATKSKFDFKAPTDKVSFDKTLSRATNDLNATQNEEVDHQQQTVISNNVTKVHESKTEHKEKLKEDIEHLINQLDEISDSVNLSAEQDAMLQDVAINLDEILATMEQLPAVQLTIVQNGANTSNEPTTLVDNQNQTTVTTVSQLLSDLKTVLGQLDNNELSSVDLEAVEKQVVKLQQIIGSDSNSSKDNALLQLQSLATTVSDEQAVVKQATTMLQRLAGKTMNLQSLVTNQLETTASSEQVEPVRTVLETASANNNTTPLVAPTVSKIETIANVAPPALVTKVPVTEFAAKVNDILVKNFSIKVGGNGIHEATISLFPAHLGQVDVKLAMQNGYLTALFVAENGSAKELIEQQMSQLKQSLSSQGIQVDKMTVSLQNDQQTSQFFQGQSSSNQQSSNRQSNTFQNGFEFAQLLDSSDVVEQNRQKQVASETLGLGRGINATI